MARIRTIKPDFWTSEQVMDLKPLTRLLFIGLWNFCDDYGRSPVAPRTIRARIFPGDDISGADVQDMLNELNAAGLILFYSAEDKEYFEITGWGKHQKIDNPSKNNLCPAPFAEGSQIIARTSEESPKIVLEGKGGDREKERKESLSDANAPADGWFEKFWKVKPRRGGADPKEPARKQFRIAIKTTPASEIIAAAQRWAVVDAGKIGTEYLPQAVKWLKDKRWVDYPPEILNTTAPADKISLDEAVSLFAKTGRWSRHAPVNDVSQAPPELLAKYGLMADGRKLPASRGSIT
jgi:hypothetical protein